VAEEQDQERTEEPTQKKLNDAIEKGNVAKSQEVSTWFVITGGTLVLIAFAGPMGASLKASLGGIIAHSGTIVVSGPDLLRLAGRLGMETLGATASPMLVLILAALAGNMIQHQLVWSTEPLKPKLSKISLLAGIKRLFSAQALVNFLKGLAKLGVIGSVMAALLWPQRHRLDALVTIDAAAILPLVQDEAFNVMAVVVTIMAIVAAADFLFQYRQWYEKQKMTMQELKEEFKQSEGSPEVKAKIRQLRQNRSRRRMMASVPTASVVITNPTHYAVALRYERGMNAPICVAKGADLVARRIRDLAREHSIPIVENPPLARALHAAVEIEDEIPAEHYQAVAEVIGYVMRMRGAVRQ
jgi:flagellar biosynthetic protein FlhB